MSDLIIRQAALVAIQNLYLGIPRVPWEKEEWADKYAPYLECERAINELPPVTPKQKKGKWIKSRDRYGNYHFTCPFCENDIATNYAGARGDNYCSDCGADMREVKT